jgi:tetratricopeptide (TPR) repeat protein
MRTEVSTLLDGWSREEVYYVAERGYRLYCEGRLHEAAILFAGLVAIDPENAYCRRALAAISSGLGQFGSAIRHRNAILECDHNDMDALAGRCEALMAAGDFRAARRDLDSLAVLPDGAQHASRLRLRFLSQVAFAPDDRKSPQLLAGPPDNLVGW